MIYTYKGFEVETDMQLHNQTEGINASNYYKCSVRYTTASDRKFYIDDFKLNIGYDIPNDSKEALEEGIQKRVDYMYNQYISSINLINATYENGEHNATPITESATPITVDRWKNIANKSLDWFAEHFEGEDLYNVLHDHLEMTDDEISNVGFDLDSMMNEDIGFHDLA